MDAKLPIETVCDRCGIYLDPSRPAEGEPEGTYDEKYRPKGTLGVDYNLSHGICPPCFETAIKEIDKL